MEVGRAGSVYRTLRRMQANHYLTFLDPAHFMGAKVAVDQHDLES